MFIDTFSIVINGLGLYTSFTYMIVHLCREAYYHAWLCHDLYLDIL